VPAVFKLRDVIYRDILSIPSLDIPAGSLFGVTGKSGGGKTTLLKLLNNLVSCDQGEIRYYDHNLLNLEPIALRRKVMMVPQSPYIFPGTVKENIRLAFYFNRKDPPAQEEAEKLLARYALSGIYNRDTGSMSGGEKQRLALVRALLLDPETLLLDEPTGALDEENAETVVSSLAEWARKPGKSVVMVSHAGGLIDQYADGMISLTEGKISDLRESRGANA
jgi:putative ABC transport system ATP-binding protein